jgi:ubiquinone/menaquinone biosynthesis C-methylase UbiE
MNTEQAYDQWASQYDDITNQTRDLEAKAIRAILGPLKFDSCLEIGCGTGKNTVWLAQKVKEIVSVDFSAEMLAKAKEKLKGEKVHFVQADINEEWTFIDRNYELVSFSLVLEHIKDLEPVFQKAVKSLRPGGYIYIGELHPFKQYSGSKARFETEKGLQVLDCFTHHISDFINTAKTNELTLLDLGEHFDEGNAQLPRLLTLLFRKLV